jgi:hypothetical protein
MLDHMSVALGATSMAERLASLDPAICSSICRLISSCHLVLAHANRGERELASSTLSDISGVFIALGDECLLV